MYIIENELLPAMTVQRGQHVPVVGCRTFFSRPISMFVFDILQIPSGCIQICSGSSASICTPLATGLCEVPAALRKLAWKMLPVFFPENEGSRFARNICA
jgi:hypothetical protein